MPIDTVASLRDFLTERKFLNTDQLDSISEGGSDVSSVLGRLRERDFLNNYQAEKILGGQEETLVIGGYIVEAESHDFPLGVAYKAIHPETRDRVVVRCRPLAEALSFDPTHADSVKALQHPHLMNVRAIGTWQQWLYQVVDEPNGAQLQKLVEEIGPMPATLAAKYVLQASQAIQTAHQAGLLHDDIRPCHLQIGPLSPTSKTRPDGTPIRRPSSSASVRLCELAYGPHVRANPDPNAVPFLPPEYSPLTKPSSACDIYMLGATLQFLLSGKPPADSAPLGSLRPDAPSPLVSLVKDMLHEIPESRPTIDVVIEMLTQIVDGKVKPKVEPPRIIDSAEVALTPAPEAEVKLEHAPLDHVPMDFIPEDSSHLTPNMQAGQEDWMAPDEFVPKAYEVSSVSSSQVGLGDKPTKPKEKAPPKPVMSRERMYLYIGLFVGMNLIGLTLLYFAFFGSKTENTPAKPQQVAPKNNKKS